VHVFRGDQCTCATRVLDDEVGDRGDDPAQVRGLVGDFERGLADPGRERLVQDAVALQQGVEGEFLRGTALGVLAHEAELAGQPTAQQPADLPDVCLEVPLQLRDHVGVA
jgi:hypothetical protein